jgi:hypothetical protein
MGPQGKTKGLKMIGIIEIKYKRRIQWDRPQIRVWKGPGPFLFVLILWIYTPT